MTSQPSYSGMEILEQLDRQREKLDAAWTSPEAAAIRALVENDGNVDWRAFVGHCGGILEVVKMVDAQGRPDADQIIPRVDELFGKTAVTPMAGGIKMTIGPRNRPYKKPAA